MRYWWVNHKQTSRHEIAGGFLWSPMRKANEARNYFYDTMRQASPGDMVISYSNAKISFFGVVGDFAIPSPKPPVFGGAGSNWHKINGWLLPVIWKPLITPVVPKQSIGKLRGLLPEKYSPISLSTGNGNQSAYLAEVGKEVFELLIPESEQSFYAVDTVSARSVGVVRDVDHAVELELLNDPSLDSTTKQRLTASRVGQGVFKERIYEFESACRLTRVTTPSFLVASHIKPWRLCLSAFERLDGANGLLLTHHVDFLFDRGFISFADDGSVLVSPRASLEDFKLLGLDAACSAPGARFHCRQLKYLEFHRQNIFLG